MLRISPEILPELQKKSMLHLDLHQLTKLEKFRGMITFGYVQWLRWNESSQSSLCLERSILMLTEKHLQIKSVHRDGTVAFHDGDQTIADVILHCTG